MTFDQGSTIEHRQVQISAQFPVRVEPLYAPQPVLPHNHDYTEITLILSGEALHRTATATQIVKAGDVIVVPPGPAHAFENPSELRVINVYYLAEWFLWDLSLLWQNEGLVPLFFAADLFRRPDLLHIKVFSLNEGENRRCRQELDEILGEYQEVSTSLLFVRAAFSKLLIRLSRAWLRLHPDLHDFVFRPAVWAALEEIDTTIKRGDVFVVKEFARGLSSSADVLYRAFRGATGLSLSGYYQQRRVQHAAHLLLHSDLSVTDIASRLGYADTSHLTHSFVKHTGQSPRALRNQKRI